MTVKELRFENYRNLVDNRIVPAPDVNVIYGENAQGKTNLLEAIWLFCGGHSFRGAKENEMISFDKKFFRLGMTFDSCEREQSADIAFGQNRKQIWINGVERSSSSYLTEVFSAVVFSPEHLNLIKRGPSVRRRFIDAAICQHRIRYASLLSKYQQIINQRNALLKDIRRHSELKDTLAIWDDSLTAAGAKIMKERYDYLKKLRDPARAYHRGISGDREELDIEYLSSTRTEENDDENTLREKLRAAFAAAQKEDFYSGYTSVGPHRDDLDFSINGFSVRRFGSQGQQRSAVLSLKLSEAELLYEKNGERPVILLDDVLSELDGSRQDFLLNKVGNYQVFVTCCEKSNKEQLKNGRVFYIENGVIG